MSRRWEGDLRMKIALQERGTSSLVDPEVIHAVVNMKTSASEYIKLPKNACGTGEQVLES